MASLTVYDGSAKPRKAVGEHQVRLLDFAKRFAGWHSYATDRTTLRAIEGLERRGSLVIDRVNKQFRY